jgi:hypothetical protein
MRGRGIGVKNAIARRGQRVTFNIHGEARPKVRGDRKRLGEAYEESLPR